MKTFIVQVIIFAFVFELTAFSNDKLDIFPTDIQYYTIQIKSFPYDDRDQALELYKFLREINYPVYNVMNEINGQYFVRVRIGAFKDINSAKAFANMLKMIEGFDFFIDYINVFVENYKDQFFIFTTSESIFYWDGEETIDLYTEPPFDNARISPDGKDILFSISHKIIKVNIKTKDVSILQEIIKSSDELIHPNASWSPDGKYIAFLMYNEWELKTELWVMNEDGASTRCLIPYDPLNDYCVKSYLWSPIENKVFYVFGYTFGTISIGGDIYLADLEGNSSSVVIFDRDNREEVYRNFRIASDTLYYKVVHHLDDQYMKREFFLRKFSLSDL